MILFRSASRLIVIACLVCPSLFGTSVDHVQETIEQWIDTNRIISETRRDWAGEQELLQQEAKLLSIELVELEEKSARLERLNSKAQLDREDAIALKEHLSGLLTHLDTRADALEKRIVRLLPAFPIPLQERIRSSTAKIGERSEGEGRMSVSARMQALVAIISEAEKFNQELLIAHELRMIDGGEPVQVRVLYWGLAGAYAVSPSGDLAQLGKPSFDGWRWENRPEFAEAITQLIRVREGSTEAAFVSLPVMIEEVSHD